MNRSSTIQGRRDIARSRARLRMLDAAGIDPRQAGRIFNRAADPTRTGADPERITIDRKSVV